MSPRVEMSWITLSFLEQARDLLWDRMGTVLLFVLL
jgi:hypothetical protein